MGVNWLDKAADWIWYALCLIVVTVFGWVFTIERWIAGLRLHMSEHYVKKTDLAVLEARISKDFEEVKQGQHQILDILLQRRIGTSGRRR
jgi:hypothetical protein